MKLKLEELTAEQKLGLVLCARCFDEKNLDFIKKMIRKHAVACFQVPVGEESEALIKELRAEADYPLIIINDMEQGYAGSDLPLLPAMTLKACNDMEYVRAFARGIVANGKAAGYSGTWCPVVDIFPMGKGGDPGRFWGESAEEVSKCAMEIARVFTENGFIATAKHFPGGLDDMSDTHMVEGKSDISEEELIEKHLKPYKDLMEQGLIQAIMTSHRTFTQIDPLHPATLSKKVMGIIRRIGFDGVIFTDSLAMMGIIQKYGEANAMAMSVEAGCDVVLPNYRNDHEVVYEMLLKCWEEGKISPERLDDAVRHILAMQNFVEENAEKTAVFTEADRKALENVTADCITAVTEEGVLPALEDKEKARLFVVLSEGESLSDVTEYEIKSYSWYQSEKLAEKIKKEFPNSEVQFMPEFPSAARNEYVLNCATNYDEVVFVTFCHSMAYLGTDCLTRRVEFVINALIKSGKVSAVVHFGNPFAVEKLLHVPRMIFGYGSAASQPYAIEVLAGKREAKGKMPFGVKVN